MPLELQGVSVFNGLVSSDRVQRIPMIHARGQHAHGAVWTHGVVIAPPRSRGSIGVFQRFEGVSVPALRAQPRVERFNVRVVRRLPGTAEVEPHILTIVHASSARDANSVPLSTWITDGFRCDLDSRLSTSLTSCAENEPRASVASASRVNWSTTSARAASGRRAAGRA